jgi:hypothetical protein
MLHIKSLNPELTNKKNLSSPDQRIWNVISVQDVHDVIWNFRTSLIVPLKPEKCSKRAD